MVTLLLAMLVCSAEFARASECNTPWTDCGKTTMTIASFPGLHAQLCCLQYEKHVLQTTKAVHGGLGTRLKWYYVFGTCSIWLPYNHIQAGSTGVTIDSVSIDPQLLYNVHLQSSALSSEAKAPSLPSASPQVSLPNIRNYC